MSSFMLPVSKRIFDFYKCNPHISFESMNLVMLNLIEQISTDMSKVQTATLTHEILSQVKDLKGQLATLQDQWSAKMHDRNREFLETTKLVINAANRENTDQILRLMEKNTDLFVEKVTIDLPKLRDDQHHTQMQTTLAQFKQQLLQDVHANLGQDTKNLQLTMEARLQHLHQHVAQQYDQLVTKFHSQEQLAPLLTDFLDKFRANVQYKGAISEQILEQLLVKIYPMAEVQKTSGLRANCDLKLKRNTHHQPDILFENKCYDGNVPAEEVKKFVRDVLEQKTHGILLSQSSGVVGKPNFHVDIHNGLIMLYLHQVNYDVDKIKTAVDLVDHLANKLATLAGDQDTQGLIISKEQLDKINQQYQQFLAKKDSLANTAKEIQRKLLAQVEELALPDLTDLLALHYTTASAQTFPCDICREVFTTGRGLSAHKRKCGAKPAQKASAVQQKATAVQQTAVQQTAAQQTARVPSPPVTLTSFFTVQTN